MDAAQKLLKNTALFLATALLIAVPGRAQSQLIVSSTTVALNNDQAQSIQVTTSGTSVLTYSLSGVPFWLTPDSTNNFTTPDSLSFRLSNSTCGTCTATVTLSATGSAPVSVTVTYSPGTTGGTGTLIASPSSLTFSAFSGQSAGSQNVSVSTTTSTAVSITNIASDQPTWLSAAITGGSFSVSANNPATLTVAASAFSLSNGTYTGHITLTPSVGTATTVTVTFNVGTGTGGTGTIIANPSSLTFSAASGQTAGSQNVTLYTNSSTATSIIGVATDEPWLQGVITAGSFSISSTSTATLTVAATAASLTNGQYIGHITITPGVGSQTVITVTFNVGTGSSNGTITASQGSLTFSANSGFAAGQQNVTLSTSSSSTISFGISSDQTWLLFSVNTASISSFTQATLAVSANAVSLANGTYTGHITITPSSGTQTVITVTFNVGGGGGSHGTITASQTSFSFSYPSNTLSGVVTIGSSNAAVTSFNVNITSQSNWLLFQNVTGSFNNVSLGQFSVSVYQTVAATLATGTYTGTITLTNPSNASDTTTINLTLTVNGGSGTGGGTLTVSPTSLLFTASPGGASQSQNLTVTAASNATVTLSAGSYNGVFFNVSSPSCSGTPNSTFTCTFAGSQTVTVTVNPGVISALGNYNGYLTFQTGSTSVQVSLQLSLTNPVTTLTVNPTALTFTAAAGSVAQAQNVTVAVPGSAQVTATLSSFNGNFYSVTSPNCNSNPSTNTVCSFNGDQTLNVQVNPATLTNPGTYNGVIQLTSGGVTTNVTVSLTLTAGTGTGGNTSSIAAPASLSFAYETNSTGALPQQVITVGPVGSFTVTSSVTTAQQWLVANTGSTTGPGYVIVSVSPQGLATGTYQGTITINSTSGTLAIPVNLLVSSGVVIEAVPGTIYFNYQAGSAAVLDSLDLVASDNSSTPVTASTTTPWISLGAPTSNTTPSALQLTLNPSGLCNGLNAGSITVSAPNAANNGFTIPVVALVTGSTVTTNCNTGGTGPLTLGASSLTFNAQVNGNLPSSQNLTVITPSTSTVFSVSSTIQSGSFNWLSIQPSGTLTGSQTLVVSVNQSGLVLGTYTATITLNTNGVVQTVQVTLNVSTTGSGSSLTVSPTALNFTAATGGNAPAAQTLSVASATGVSGAAYTYLVQGNIPITASVNNVQLQNGQSLTTPTTITINVSATGLATGTYNGTITLTTSTGSISIPVTLTVTAASVSASPTTLSFTYNAGSAVPSPATVTVSGSSGLAFTATASSSGNWLAVSPTAGTTPASLSVSVSPASLTAGTYTGTITVAGTGSASGTTTITVTLTVTAPFPTITSVGSAASYLGGSLSPGEIITIFGTSIGPTPGVTLALDSTGKVATSLGGVQVVVNGFLAPMVYASSGQVSAVVPYEICATSCGPGTIAQVVVKFLGQSSNGIPTPVAATTTAIFTANASGSGPGAILNANSSVNSPANPANKGDTVAIYMTGEGQTGPGGVTGKVTTVSATGPLTPVPLLPVAVLIDGQPASISFAGEAPGLVSGVMQLNVQIPPNARSGALSLVVSIGGVSSQQGVTVSVK